MRAVILIVALSGVLGFVQSASAEPPDSHPADAATPESELLQKMMRGDQENAIYLDVDGTPLDYAAYTAKVKREHVMSDMSVDPETGTATFRITTKPAPTLDSLIHPSLAVAVGGPLPALNHADLSGRKHDFRDGRHYTLLSFYFSECAPCIQEIPELNALKQRAPNLQVVSITFDDKATARQFVEQRGLQWPVVGDAKDFIDALGVKTYPTMVAVSPEGRLLGSRSAYVVSDDKDKQLAELKDWLASLSVRM